MFNCIVASVYIINLYDVVNVYFFLFKKKPRNMYSLCACVLSHLVSCIISIMSMIRFIDKKNVVFFLLHVFVVYIFFQPKKRTNEQHTTKKKQRCSALY